MIPVMDKIRRATPEEIERIAPTADLNESCTVLAFGEGENAEFAVLRNVIEIDPLVSRPTNAPKRKALFVWAIENMLRFTGVSRYYFNVSADDNTWQDTVKKWGAEQVSAAPEFRFRKDL